MLHQMSLHAAGDLQKEIEANAEMCALSAKRLVQIAPHIMTAIGHRMATWPDGEVAIQCGTVTSGIVTKDNLALFRNGSGLRTHEGLTAGDLGGIPADDFLGRVVATDRLLKLAAKFFGTRSPSETCGFLVWSFLRLLNSVREDFPGGTIGVASRRQGDFIPVFGPSPTQASEWVIFLNQQEPRR